MSSKREQFKAADVCELARLQPYVLRSWESEFPGLGKPGAGGVRVYDRHDVELVLRIKQLVFVEGLTLAGARRRLEQKDRDASIGALAVDRVLDEIARARLRDLRDGLEAILKLLESNRHETGVDELALVAPRSKPATGKRRKAS